MLLLVVHVMSLAKPLKENDLSFKACVMYIFLYKHTHTHTTFTVCFLPVEILKIHKYVKENELQKNTYKCLLLWPMGFNPHNTYICVKIKKIIMKNFFVGTFIRNLSYRGKKCIKINKNTFHSNTITF